MSMVDPSLLNLTISHCNQSPRRALQIHLPRCSTCSYTCRVWLHSLLPPSYGNDPPRHTQVLSPNLALRLHWILPSTNATCPPSKRKPSNWLLRQMLICMSWLISSSLADPITSRRSYIHCVPTGNTVNHLLFKMDLCSVEKTSSSLNQKGRRSLVHCICHTKASPKHRYLSVVASSGLASTRPLRRRFCNVKHA